MGWLRNPVLVGLALLATVAGAFQVAGVVSILLANVLLASGVWIFITVEVWCSHWVRRAGRYLMCVVLLSSGCSGIIAVRIADLISTMKRHQAAEAGNQIVPYRSPIPFSQKENQNKLPELIKDRSVLAAENARIEINNIVAIVGENSTPHHLAFNFFYDNYGKLPVLGIVHRVVLATHDAELTEDQVNSGQKNGSGYQCRSPI